MGIDYGEKRIGISISDPLKIIASDYSVIKNETLDQVIEEIHKIIEDQKIERIIIGLPINMNNSEGFQSKIVREFALNLKKFEKKIIFVDERESSKKAEQVMKELKIDKKKIRYTSDAKAASVILQDYLDYSI